MSSTHRPVQPVAPSGMDMLFYYLCPYCGQRMALLAPTQPAQVYCEACGQPFPILPVDDRTVRFLKIMLDNGRAATDPDFV